MLYSDEANEINTSRKNNTAKQHFFDFLPQKYFFYFFLKIYI